MRGPGLSTDEREDAKEPNEELDEDRSRGLKREYGELEQRYKDLEDTLKWLQAEYENYKKGVQKSVDRAIERGEEKLVYELLPVLDSMEELIKMDLDESLLKGVEAIRKSMLKALSDQGLEPLSRVGKLFDPGIEEAIDVVESDEDGIVIEEIRKGYKFRGKILRHPLVKISKAKNRGDKGD